MLCNHHLCLAAKQFHQPRRKLSIRKWMLTKLIVVIISKTVCQVIMVYMLNLCSAVGQLYLNKTRRKTSESMQCCDGIMYMVS